MQERWWEPRHVSAPSDVPVPGGDHCTMSRPWHANIMNGPANEGLLIDYGENRVLLTQWWQLRGVLRHFVNALFFHRVQAEGSLYWPSDRGGHLACDEVIYFYDISLSSYMFYNTQRCVIFLSFFAVHASIHINSAN